MGNGSFSQVDWRIALFLNGFQLDTPLDVLVDDEWRCVVCC